MPYYLLVCSASRYEQYLGWHFILRYSTFASKLYVNNNSRGSKDGAAAFSYGTDMRNFCVGEKNVLLFSLGASPVAVYWFSALVGSFAQLSTVFLQAQHAQILPEVRYRPFHSLCCYVRYTVWCSMLIECHSGEALSYTKGHHSLVHSLPCCGIIQDDIVSAESNCKQDAPDSLFSSTIQKHLVCSEGFDPGIWLLLESSYIFPIICLSSISMPNLIILHNGSDITWAYMKKVGDAQMVEFLQEALVSQLIHYTVQNLAYWPVWIHQHHGWMIRFPSAIVPACFNNLPWLFIIHALVLVCGLYIYWGQLTRGFIEDCCPWAEPLLMCSSFTRMLHMATNNDSKYGVLSFCNGFETNQRGHWLHAAILFLASGVVHMGSFLLGSLWCIWWATLEISLVYLLYRLKFTSGCTLACGRDLCARLDLLIWKLVDGTNSHHAATSF